MFHERRADLVRKLRCYTDMQSSKRRLAETLGAAVCEQLGRRWLDRDAERSRNARRAAGNGHFYVKLRSASGCIIVVVSWSRRSDDKIIGLLTPD